jgi:hypothetical protein
LICRSYKEVKNDSEIENLWTEKYYHATYPQSLFHQVLLVFVKTFLISFVMVWASICYPPYTEEGEKQYDNQESKILFTHNYCKKVLFDSTSLEFLVSHSFASVSEDFAIFWGVWNFCNLGTGGWYDRICLYQWLLNLLDVFTQWFSNFYTATCGRYDHICPHG